MGSTPSGDLVILAVQRRDEDQGPDETVLAAGDTLLLQGTWEALDEHLDDPDGVGRFYSPGSCHSSGGTPWA